MFCNLCLFSVPLFSIPLMYMSTYFKAWGIALRKHFRHRTMCMKSLSVHLYLYNHLSIYLFISPSLLESTQKEHRLFYFPVSVKHYKPPTHPCFQLAFAIVKVKFHTPRSSLGSFNNGPTFHSS